MQRGVDSRQGVQ